MENIETQQNVKMSKLSLQPIGFEGSYKQLLKNLIIILIRCCTAPNGLFPVRRSEC